MRWNVLALLGARLAIPLALLALTECTGRGVAGATCSTDSECVNDLQCLFPIGAGCDAQGYCRLPSAGCLTGTQDLILCGCDTAPVDTTCIDQSAALPERTATGPECSTEAGSDSAPE
jgi:hypothetical protein